jgi:hypothetical protein
MPASRRTSARHAIEPEPPDALRIRGKRHDGIAVATDESHVAKERGPELI